MRRVVTAAVAALVFVSGCQKLNDARTIDVMPRGVRKVEYSAPTYAQPVEVTISPEGGSVSAYLVKQSDADAVEKALDANQEPDSKLVLAGKTFKSNDAPQEFTLKASVPAKTAYALLLHGGGKESKAKVKLVGK